MCVWVNWLNQNEGAALFFATAAAGAVAFVALVTSSRTARRATNVAELATRAEIGAVLVATGMGMVNPGPQGAQAAFMIRNIGRAPAEGVEAELLVAGVRQGEPRQILYIAGREMSGESPQWQVSFGIPGEHMRQKDDHWNSHAPQLLRITYADSLGEHVATYAPEIKRRSRRRGS